MFIIDALPTPPTTTRLDTEDKQLQSAKYVQYGCGWSAPDEWLNFDASPTLRFERIPLVGKLYTKNAARFPENVRYGDITKGLPVPANSCDGAYCSHVLEHLALEDFRIALRNTHSLLKPGGDFRMVLPDLRFYAEAFIADTSKDSAPTFMRKSFLGYTHRPRGIAGIVSAILGNSKHLWMWDFASINAELIDAGFTDVRRAEFNDSGNKYFDQVEAEDRWIDCLGIHCKK